MYMNVSVFVLVFGIGFVDDDDDDDGDDDDDDDLFLSFVKWPNCFECNSSHTFHGPTKPVIQVASNAIVRKRSTVLLKPVIQAASIRMQLFANVQTV